MMAKEIKVIIADDHCILREGLKQILSENDEIIIAAEARTAIEAIQIARNTQADVMLLDISLPDKNGIEALKVIKKDAPGLAILMLSMHKEEEYAVRALRAGASGYISKQSASSELVQAIHLASKGKKYLSASVAEALANHLDESDRPKHNSLSDREFQTLAMIASGLTVGDIAVRLNLSVKTISVYRARLLEKMGLHNNAELTHYAIKNQLVEAA
jgi:two-component system, NarL family, invasion response regulator UvrY